MKTCIACLLILSPLSLFAGTAVPTQFNSQGENINPVCIWLLLSHETHSGYNDKGNRATLNYFEQTHHNLIQSINLDVCQQSKTAGKIDNHSVDNTPYPLVTYHFPWGIKGNYAHTLARGYFGYQYIGQLQNGALVIKTVDSGGGSGQFSGLALLRKTQKITQFIDLTTGHKTKQQHTALSLVSFIRGGDRAAGGIKTISIQGNAINLKEYNPKNTPNQPYHRELNKTVTFN